MTEQNPNKPPKLNHATGAPPPKLKKPMSSGTKFTLFAGAAIALTTGLAVISGDSYESGDSGAGSSLTVDDAANIVVETTTGPDGNALEPPFESVSQEGTVVRTAFAADWSATRSGRQVLFVDPSKKIFCQSLVQPIAEYNEIMSQFPEGLAQYSTELANATGAQSGAEVRVASSEALPTGSIEGGEATWHGAKILVEYQGANGTARRSSYTAASTNAEHAAMLTCSSDDSEAAGEIMEQMVRGYLMQRPSSP